MGRLAIRSAAMWCVLIASACSDSDPAPSSDVLPSQPVGGTSPATAGSGALAAGSGAPIQPGSGGTGAATAGSAAAGSAAMAGTPGAAGQGSGGIMAMPQAGMDGAGTAAAGGSGVMEPATPGDWPAADPGMMGPFATVTENEVGYEMAFTMFRPMELTQRHPVITWGNGTGASPSAYRQLLNLYASHGFIVIASNSPNVAQGDPPPMLHGVTWVLEQDMTEGTALYGHVDRERIGATGHSQGAFAASRAGTDPRIVTIAPIQTLGVSRGLHGPVLGLCGGMDEIVPCSGNLRAYEGVSDQPAMYAELKAADHGSWLFSRGGGVAPMHMITAAWFRVHLMNDTALRPMFYGECSLCQDTETWATMRKMMDQ